MSVRERQATSGIGTERQFAIALQFGPLSGRSGHKLAARECGIGRK